jgi:hypothetical protein
LFFDTKGRDRILEMLNREKTENRIEEFGQLQSSDADLAFETPSGKIRLPFRF